MTNLEYTRTEPKNQQADRALTGADTLRWLAEQAPGDGFTLCCGPKHNCAHPGKVPHETEWQNKPHTLPEALTHLAKGGNVGHLGPALVWLDIDAYWPEFIEYWRYETAPAIVRDDPDRGKLLIRVKGETTGGVKRRLHDTDDHPIIEYICGTNAVVAGVHERGEIIRLINPAGEIPELPETEIIDIVEIWLEVLGLPAPAPEYTPKPEPIKAQEAAKAAGLKIATVKDLREAVERCWTPYQVFEHFKKTAGGVQQEGGGWVRVRGNSGLFVKGEGQAQFWSLTGATGAAKVPGGGAIQAWIWCESGGARWTARGKEFVDVLRAMAEAGGILLPAELVSQAAAERRNGSDPAQPAEAKKTRKRREEVDFSELVDPTEEDNDLTPGSWADLAVNPVAWDWPSWLARGFVTLLSAESGTGKSVLALRLAGCYLRGDPWPDGSQFTGERGAVLWCEAEAAHALNRERAEKWGLPVADILTPIAAGADFTLTNINHVQALKAAAFWPNVRLIVIDSLSAAYPSIEKGTEYALPVMKWLARLARDSGKIIVAPHHLRKRGMMDGDTVELDRLRGASAIVQPARLVWAMDTPDPGAKDNKRLSVIKSNLGKYPEPVGLRIGDNGVTFGAAPEIPKTETVTDRAVEMLIALLQQGPQPASVIENEFDQAGISRPTMYRAKEKLGIVSRKDKTGWFWGLPVKGQYEL